LIFGIYNWHITVDYGNQTFFHGAPPVPSHLEKWGARAPRARWFRRHWTHLRVLSWRQTEYLLETCQEPIVFVVTHTYTRTHTHTPIVRRTCVVQRRQITETWTHQ